MTKGFPRGLPFAISFVLSLGVVAFGPARAAQEEDPDEPFALERVAPVYPESLARAGVEGEVRLSVLVSETGSVAEVRIVSGLPAFATAAATAVRKWRFRRPVTNGVPQRVWIQVPIRFRLDPRPFGAPAPAASAEHDSNWTDQGRPPELLVRIPICGDPEDPTRFQTSNAKRAFRILVGKTGRVEDVRWSSPPPARVDELVARLRRWIYLPATTSRTGPTVKVWQSVGIPYRDCDSLYVRPDSDMLGVLLATDSIHVERRNTNSGALRAVPLTKGFEGRSTTEEWIGSHLRTWLLDERAYGGLTPWNGGLRPRADWLMDFHGPNGSIHVEIASESDWMTLTQEHKLLYVPYGLLHREVSELLDGLASDAAIADSMGRRR